MGLVDYSDSDSDSDSGAEPAQAGPAPAPAPAPAPVPSARPNTRKQPAVAKIIDRSNPGQILVSLPAEVGPEQPPAKRARIAAGGSGGSGGGGGTFASLNSFLPAPKNPNAKSRPAGGGGGSGGGASRATFRPGMRLKTSAEPAFSRTVAPNDGYEDDGNEDYGADAPPSGPMPRAGTQPPLETANAGKVELVGKPLMFMPPSVARNIAKTRAPVVAAPPNARSAASRAATAAGAAATAPPPPPQPKSTPLALFSTYTEPEPDPVTTRTGSYELVPASTSTTPYSQPSDPYPPPHASESSYPSAEAGSAQSLDGIADELNLSASERRELLGRRRRGGGGERTADVRLVDMGAEYEKNEAMRASGELQAQTQPVRALQPGKHSVRQLVNMVHNQRDALEESFSQGKINKREAGARYGW